GRRDAAGQHVEGGGQGGQHGPVAFHAGGSSGRRQRCLTCSAVSTCGGPAPPTPLAGRRDPPPRQQRPAQTVPPSSPRAAPAAQTEPPVEEVRAVLAEVRERGDAALRDFAARYDGVELDDLRVSPDEVARALEEIPADLRAALEVAHANIAAYHTAQLGDEVVHRNGAVEVREVVRPVDRAGCYVPSALAPLA